MIEKISNYKNGYRITATTTKEEYEEILSQYDIVRCIICNSNTKKYFYTPFYGSNCLTINNNLEDNCFFINTII